MRTGPTAELGRRLAMKQSRLRFDDTPKVLIIRPPLSSIRLFKKSRKHEPMVMASDESDTLIMIAPNAIKITLHLPIVKLMLLENNLVCPSMEIRQGKRTPKMNRLISLLRSHKLPALAAR
jgi:hypothetical protein